MFKFFGVSDKEEGEITDDAVNVEIMDDGFDEEKEVGQIAVDVIEAHDDVYIIAPIAGVDLQDIDITLNKTILTIKGTRKQTKEYDIDGIIIRNNECFWGDFIRNVILPENLALNKIKAYMENNLLVITIPKLKFDSKNIKIDKIED